MYTLGVIYLITNTVNGKRYVGQTVQDVSRRFGRHIAAAHRGSTFALHRATRKHGEHAFRVEVIAESFEPFLDDLERMCIALYNTFGTEHGYNMTAGGDAPMRGRKHSASTIAKFKKRTGSNHSFFGKHWTAAHAANFSKARTGVQQHQRAGRTGYKGVTFTQGYRKPYRAQISGKWCEQFDTAEEAALAYNAKAIEMYGSKAILNTITDTH